ncbi:MAG: anthranilate synthase component I family protein, partial [Deltaproteobacteria bacterium]|nr:anthranilate synthase component I family protein [Deltaproteobacteria bacterium]
IEPVQAFLRVRSLGNAFIISGVHGDGVSYVGAGPTKRISGTKARTTVKDSSGGSSEVSMDPLEYISEELNNIRIDSTLPFPFIGGAVGFISYAASAFESHSEFGIYDNVYAYDHNIKKGFLISVSTNGEMDEVINARLSDGAADELPCPLRSLSSQVSSNTTKEEYIDSVNKALELIRDGEIYQVNLTQSLTAKLEGDPFSLFLELSRNTPSRFTSFIETEELKIICNSPERLFKVSSGWVETEPIKGTRPRGNDKVTDEFFMKELMESEKERAEHVMITDLERNDIGKISRTGTVHVKDFMRIESYPALHHMVSTVRGLLRDGLSTPLALKEFLPGGSVTGTPKIRATEVIKELENFERGIYTGGIGWMGYGGGAELTMAIRTAVIKDDVMTLGVGSGIVIDSDPAQEYEETLLKANDFLTALGVNAKTIS